MAFDPSKVRLTPVDELPEEIEDTKKVDDKAKPKKPTRKKPTYSLSRYNKTPVAKVINRGIVDGANNTLLKDKKKKLDKDSCEVGEAVMYMVEYYSALDINHPALVMLSACMGVAFTVMECMDGGDKADKDRKTPAEKVDINEGAKK